MYWKIFKIKQLEQHRHYLGSNTIFLSKTKCSNDHERQIFNYHALAKSHRISASSKVDL